MTREFSRKNYDRCELDIDAERSTSLRSVQIDVIRRYAMLVALLAAVAQISMLALGVANWQISLALAIPIVIAILCGISTNWQAGRTYQNALQTGLAGGVALVGIGLHSTAGVFIAAAALLVLARFPVPPLPQLVVGLAATSPWIAEAIAGAQGIGSMLLGVLVIAVIVLIWVRSKDLEVLVVSLCLAVIVYVGAAVVLFLVGFRAGYSEEYLAQALTSYGPFTFRWRLPLSVSWVSVPTVATIGAVLCVWVLRIDRRRIGSNAVAIKGICASGLVLNLVAVVATNGRTHLIAAIVGVIVASGVLPRAARNLMVLAFSALWLAPLWWNRLAGARDSIIATILTNYLPNRGAADRTVTLQGRTIIWDISLDVFNRGSLGERVSGWGPNGYIASGAASEYSSVLGGIYRSGYYPPHNTILEVLLSGGLALAVVVLASIALLFVMQVSVLRHGPDPAAAGIAGLAITLAAVAFSEVAVLPSNASAAGFAVPLVTLVTLVAYGQTLLSRKRQGSAGSGFPARMH